MSTSAEKILLSGVKTAWIYSLVPGTPDTFSLKYSFDNLANGSIKVPRTATAANSNNVDVTAADGGITRFPAETYIVSGIDDTEIISEDGGLNSSGLGEITLVTNEAPIESSSVTSFLNELKNNPDDTYLIIVPTGYSYNRTGAGTAKKPDGFAYMFGQRTSDLDLAMANSVSTISLTFAAQKSSTDLTSGSFTADGIIVRRGGTGKDILADVNFPIALVSGDIDNLKLGKIVLKETASV